MTTTRPLCLILMPYGTKQDLVGGDVELDRVYRDVLEPAVEDAGMRATWPVGSPRPDRPARRATPEAPALYVKPVDRAVG